MTFYSQIFFIALYSVYGILLNRFLICDIYRLPHLTRRHDNAICEKMIGNHFRPMLGTTVDTTNLSRISFTAFLGWVVTHICTIETTILTPLVIETIIARWLSFKQCGVFVV